MSETNEKPPSDADQLALIDPTEEEEEALGEYDDDEWEGEDEDDLLYAMAEEAKEEIRIQLRELKAIYRSIRQRNGEIPEQFRLKESELKLPAEIFEEDFARIEEQCDEVYRIHEYESAETIIQMEKIKKFYFDPIDCPHIVVKDICHDLQVHTMRYRKVTKQFQELNEKNLELIEEEARMQRLQAIATETELQTDVHTIQRIYAKDIIGEYESKLDTYDIDTVHNIRHLEKRLLQRYNREVAWQQLMSQKIEPDYIPPEDAELLESAKAETGAFQLQNSESYLGEHITIAERRQRVINLKIAMREQTQDFNRMVVEARDEKPRILQECRRLEREIRKIHVLLPEDFRRKIPPIYDMEFDENPESIMDIRQEEVDAEEMALLEKAGLQNIKEDINEDYFGIKKPEKTIFVEEEETSAPFLPPPPAARTARQAKTVDLEFETVASHRRRKIQATGQSDIEKKSFEVKFYPILYKQELLFKDLMQIINYFHERVKYLHDTRVRLELDFKVKTVGLLTVICELDIAKEFDAQEKGILERLRAQQAECKDAKKQMEKIKKRLVKVNTDMKKCEQDILGISKEVEAVIGGKGRFSEYLWRVFKKKVKLEQDGENDEDEDAPEFFKRHTSSTDSTDSSGSTSQDSGSDLFKLPKQKMDVNICPEHLDRGIYNKIIELRQKKAAIEQEMDSNKRLGEKVSAEYIDIEKIYVKYEGRLTDISEEIRVLQRRRQKKMNDLQILIVLRADQIQCMDMDEIADMEGELLDKLAKGFPGTGNVIIFPKGGAGGLETRSSELAKKAKDEKNKYKKGKHMLFRLRQELKKCEKEVTFLKGKVKKEMILKFGQEVDLDKITAVIINLELLDQEILLDKMKKAQYREREKMAEEIEEVKYKLTKKIEEHSKFNMLKAMMLERRRDLEYYIWKNDPKNKPKRFNRSEENNKEDNKVDDKKAVEDDGQGVSKKTSLIPIERSLTDQDIQSNQLERDIKNARQILIKQQHRINELKSVLQKCRTKTGLPQLIPITQAPETCGAATTDEDPVISQKKPLKKFTKTAQEMPNLNQYCQIPVIQGGLQTLFKSSQPRTPSFTTTPEPPPTTIPDDENQDLTFSDANETKASELNFDYDSADDETDDGPDGGAAAVRDLRDTIAEYLPSNEEEEFFKYVEETGIDDVEAALAEASKLPLLHPSALLGRDKDSKRIGFNDNKSVVLIPSVLVTPDIHEDDEDDEEEGVGGGKRRKSFKGKKASRKSILQIAQVAKTATESDIMGKIKKMSMGSQALREEHEHMQALDFVGDETRKAMAERKVPTKSATSQTKSAKEKLRETML